MDLVLEGEGISAQAQPIKLLALAVMLQMIQGFLGSRAMCAVAELGIADLLKNGPMKSEELAQGNGAHAPSLYRILRALASGGVFIGYRESQSTFPAGFLSEAGCSARVV